MQRYPVIVCRNCGTEYNATRSICPGYKCFEPTPKLEGVEFKEREFRTGPVISDSASIPAHTDSEGQGPGSIVADAPAIAAEEDDTQEMDEFPTQEDEDE